MSNNISHPRIAASIAATSIFVICIIASNARLATAGSGLVIACDTMSLLLRGDVGDFDRFAGIVWIRSHRASSRKADLILGKSRVGLRIVGADELSPAGEGLLAATRVVLSR